LAVRKSRPHVLLRTLRRELYRSRPAPHKEVSLRDRLHPLPLEKHWLRTSLTAHHAYCPAVDDLRFGIDASASAITKAIAHHLSQVTHELVIVLELVLFDPHDRSVIGDAD